MPAPELLGALHFSLISEPQLEPMEVEVLSPRLFASSLDRRGQALGPGFGPGNQQNKKRSPLHFNMSCLSLFLVP